MIQLLTRTALGALMAASLTANAQFKVDGRASADEIGTGPGKYQLAGTYTGNHLDADRGVKALYAGYTATTLNIMVVGSAEPASGSRRAILLYLNTMANIGAPAGIQLAGGNDALSPLKTKPTMDQIVDFGFRASVGPATGTDAVQFSYVSYISDTPRIVPGTDTPAGFGSKRGAVETTAADTPLPGTKLAYLNTASLTVNTTNAGLEIAIPLAALGSNLPVRAGSLIHLFAAYTDDNGGFLSETIPQVAGQTTALSTNPNFASIAGTQSVAFVLGSGVLATRSELANAFAFSVYPNPVQGVATVVYTVPAGQQPVSLTVYNALGQRVRNVISARQAGRQQLPLGGLLAGAYLVKLQVGEQVTSRKLVVQ